MKNLNRATHLLYQAHTGIKPVPLCSECASEFNSRQHSYWDFTSPLDKPSRHSCSACRSKVRQQAYSEGRILWRVFLNGVFQFETTDRFKAYPKENWKEYSRYEVILKRR